MQQKGNLDPLQITKYWNQQNPPDLAQLKRTGQKFTDPYFPPNLNSLLSKDYYGNFVDGLKGPKQEGYLEEDLPGSKKGRLTWKRATDVYPQWQLFEGKIEFNDVQQGGLGDCYFLSSITALTEYPLLIKEKFRTKEFNPEGYYEMIFFIDGEWQIVFVDDFFPYDTKTKTWAFASPNGKELWAILLEKAWAKLNGGYSNAIGGMVSEPISSLTGFPTEYLDHKEFENDELYKKIEICDEEGTLMSSASKDDADIENKGLVQAHAYTLIEAKKWERRNIYLFKLRNPWGEKEWTGKWSDNSPFWTEEYKKYFGVVKKNDGIFWIDVDDYTTHFDSTYVCHILYGAVVKNFYFEYDAYFKKPAIFNLYIKEKSKTSVRVLFKNWRFNRDIHDVIHPFSLIVAKYDKDRKIKKMMGKWSSKDDVNLIEELTPGYYAVWLYCAYDGVKNDPHFKFAVQISAVKPFDVEFIGLDHSFQFIQFLLLENYTVTGANNLSSSKEYFLGNDKEVNKMGLNNILMYNKTNSVLEINVSEKKIKNVSILPPYTGLKNIKVTIPPYERAALIGVRLSNESVNFSYGFQLTITHDQSKYENSGLAKQNFGNRYKNYMKLSLDPNQNTDIMGIRTGEYKYVGIKKAQELPIFDKSKFIGKEVLNRSMMQKDEVTPQSLMNEYPVEIQLLFKYFPNDPYPNDYKKWEKIPSSDGIYLGEFNSYTGELMGRGVFIWKNGMKYIGNWKNGGMAGKGLIVDKDNYMIFDGTFYNSKKYGKGTLYIKGNEHYEGEFFDDKMEGRGVYYYQSGDKWEGNFRNNMKNGVGIMTYSKNNDVFLVEFENDNYLGGTQLSQEEKQRVEGLRDKEKKELLEKEKQRQIERERELQYQEQKRKEIEQMQNLEKKRQAIEEEKRRQEEMRRQKELEYRKYCEEQQKQQMQWMTNSVINFGGNEGGYGNYNNNYQSIYMQNNFNPTSVTVQQNNFEAQETPEEKKHRIFLEKIEEYKKVEPFMMEKFLQLRLLNNSEEEEMNYINSNGSKYVGGGVIKTDERGGSSLQMEGRGVFFDGNSYLAGYWENNLPNGYFFKYNDKKELVFKGYLSSDSTINPSYPGYLYLENGDSYHGYFFQNKMNGFGTYYYAKGDSWTGNFTFGQFNGQGKYFYDNGLISEDITYNNNQEILRRNKGRDDLKDPNAINFFNQMKVQYPGVIERILNLPPLREAEEILIWQNFVYKDGTTYIGQVNSEKQCHGRCCFIYKNSPITYYIGYIKKQEVYGEGSYYDSNWNKKYDGTFIHNKKTGFGVQIQSDGSTYAGFFSNDKPNGLGVLYYQNGSRFEGNFVNGEKNDKGYLISPDPKTMHLVTKQEVVYKNDNVIEQGDIINFTKSKYKKKYQENFDVFEKECIDQGYGKYLELLMDLKPTDESVTLKFGIKQEISGVYIGEMNSIGFKYGRGILLSHFSKVFYIGYFVNNEKHGKGVLYYDFDKPKYIGEFLRNKMTGKGEYYYENGEILDGDFNYVGEGTGVYTFANGDFWKGNFFAWTKNGQGEYYNKEGQFINYKSYDYDN